MPKVDSLMQADTPYREAAPREAASREAAPREAASQAVGSQAAGSQAAERPAVALPAAEQPAVGSQAAGSQAAEQPAAEQPAVALPGLAQQGGRSPQEWVPPSGVHEGASELPRPTPRGRERPIRQSTLSSDPPLPRESPSPGQCSVAENRRLGMIAE
jgi:hypothetical protein